MLYYFAHPTNMRVMRDVIRMRQREGALGYGVYMMLLEFIRESEDQRVYDDAESIAFALNEQDTALISRIIHDFSLFELTDDGYIISPFLEKARKEAEEAKAKARENGLKGAKARYHQDTTTMHNPQHTYNVSTNEDAPSMGGGIEGLTYNQKDQKGTTKKEEEKKPTKSKLVSMEWLGIAGQDWLNMCRSKPLLDLCAVEERFGGLCSMNHNPLMLRDWFANWPVPEQLYTTLRAISDDWRIDHPVFIALNAVRVHVEKTNYTPIHPWEYLIFNAINFYNSKSIS